MSYFDDLKLKEFEDTLFGYDTNTKNYTKTDDQVENYIKTADTPATNGFKALYSGIDIDATGVKTLRAEYDPTNPANLEAGKLDFTVAIIEGNLIITHKLAVTVDGDAQCKELVQFAKTTNTTDVKLPALQAKFTAHTVDHVVQNLKSYNNEQQADFQSQFQKTLPFAKQKLTDFNTTHKTALDNAATQQQTLKKAQETFDDAEKAAKPPAKTALGGDPAAIFLQATKHNAKFWAKLKTQGATDADLDANTFAPDQTQLNQLNTKLQDASRDSRISDKDLTNAALKTQADASLKALVDDIKAHKNTQEMTDFVAAQTNLTAAKNNIQGSANLVKEHSEWQGLVNNLEKGSTPAAKLLTKELLDDVIDEVLAKLSSAELEPLYDMHPTASVSDADLALNIAELQTLQNGKEAVIAELNDAKTNKTKSDAALKVADNLMQENSGLTAEQALLKVTANASIIQNKPGDSLVWNKAPDLTKPISVQPAQVVDDALKQSKQTEQLTKDTTEKATESANASTEKFLAAHDGHSNFGEILVQMNSYIENAGLELGNDLVSVEGVHTFHQATKKPGEIDTLWVESTTAFKGSCIKLPMIGAKGGILGKVSIIKMVVNKGDDLHVKLDSNELKSLTKIEMIQTPSIKAALSEPFCTAKGATVMSKDAAEKTAITFSGYDFTKATAPDVVLSDTIIAGVA